MAAAQRRLAALAAQFETAAPARRDESAGVDATTPADSADSAEPGRHAARVNAVKEYGRWELTAHHVTLAALAAVVLIAVTGWWILRAVPDPEAPSLESERVLPSTGASTAAVNGAGSGGVPLPGQSVTTGPGIAPATAGSDADASAASSEVVIVDVAGKVRRPGIVELPPGSRIVDALDSAGGVRPGVDTSALNLARVLVDGEQIVVGLEVPVMPPPPSGAVASSTAGTPILIDLNTATQEQLETLPGIGPVTAVAILTWRSENGAFTSVDELLEISGIGDATLADVETYVYV